MIGALIYCCKLLESVDWRSPAALWEFGLQELSLDPELFTSPRVEASNIEQFETAPKMTEGYI